MVSGDGSAYIQIKAALELMHGGIFGCLLGSAHGAWLARGWRSESKANEEVKQIIIK